MRRRGERRIIVHLVLSLHVLENFKSKVSICVNLLFRKGSLISFFDQSCSSWIIGSEIVPV